MFDHYTFSLIENSREKKTSETLFPDKYCDGIISLRGSVLSPVTQPVFYVIT